jgi:hypothetical protein
VTTTDPFIDPYAVQFWAEDMGLGSIMYTAWGWPLVEILHFTGLCFLMASVGMFDLRMMGVVKGISLKALHRMIPFGVAGFVLNVITGTMFVLADTAQYIYNPAWQTKMALIGIAGINMITFYLTISKRVYALGPDDTPPIAARVIAAVSLFSWLGVIMAGRVITAFRPPFHWCLWCS